MLAVLKLGNPGPFFYIFLSFTLFLLYLLMSLLFTLLMTVLCSDGSGYFFGYSGWTGSATSRFEKFPLKIPNFQYFSLHIKKTSWGFGSKNI